MQSLATQQPSTTSPTPGPFDQTHPRRKRKADVQDGERERLSKRLSLLRIGHKHTGKSSPRCAADDANPPGDEPMHIDDSKHKVFIYNIDDELSSDDSAGEEDRLVFLPGMDKCLERIAPRVVANRDGQLAGMQLVLYHEPKSLSVPEERDGVRKAILEARQRLRDKQRGEATPRADALPDDDAMEID